MTRFVACVAALGLLTLTLLSSDPTMSQTVYSVDRWPQDLDKVPCDAWKKNADGSWLQAADIKVGRNLLVGGGNLDASESKLVEGKCGKN